MSHSFGTCGCGLPLTLPSERDFAMCIDCRQRVYGSIYPEPMTSLLGAAMIARFHATLKGSSGGVE